MAPSAGARPNVEIAATAVMILNPRRMYPPKSRRANRRDRIANPSRRGPGFDSECRKSVALSLIDRVA